MNLLKKNIKNNFTKGIVESNKKLKDLEKYKEYELPTFIVASIKEKEEIFSDIQDKIIILNRKYWHNIIVPFIV